ncbi:hypothetical protein M405DRAFT_433716 [Rhizopogon salebrosus TDB-379]|nr:hypothetical protein M405DRAFT_433716 [Rhizopogon salebrosus TDB-379]
MTTLARLLSPPAPSRDIQNLLAPSRHLFTLPCTFSHSLAPFHTPLHLFTLPCTFAAPSCTLTPPQHLPASSCTISPSWHLLVAEEILVSTMFFSSVLD